jgi:hypothetical protein
VAAGLTATGVGEVFFDWRSGRDGFHAAHVWGASSESCCDLARCRLVALMPLGGIRG